jgi:integrase
MIKQEILNNFTEYVKRNYLSKDTQNVYISGCNKFLNYNHPDSIKNLSKYYLQQYLDSFLIGEHISLYNQQLSIIKIIFINVLKRPFVVSDILPIQQKRKLKNIPEITFLSKKIKLIENIKHRAIILTLLSTGVRISELLNIKLSDIKSSDMKILIECGKGGRGRFIPLTTELLCVLREHFKTNRPIYYLFEYNGCQYSKTSVRKVVKKYIDEKSYPHIFRHVYISYMINNNVNLKKIKNITGHNSDKSVEWYYQYSDKTLEREINPIKELCDV